MIELLETIAGSSPCLAGLTHWTLHVRGADTAVPAAFDLAARLAIAAVTTGAQRPPCTRPRYFSAIWARIVGADAGTCFPADAAC